MHNLLLIRNICSKSLESMSSYISLFVLMAVSDGMYVLVWVAYRNALPSLACFSANEIFMPIASQLAKLSSRASFIN